MREWLCTAGGRIRRCICLRVGKDSPRNNLPHSLVHLHLKYYPFLDYVEKNFSTEERSQGCATHSAFRRFASPFEEPSRRLRFFSVAPASSKSSSEKSPSESDMVGVKGKRGRAVLSVSDFVVNETRISVITDQRALVSSQYVT